MAKIPDEIIESVSNFKRIISSMIKIEKVFLYGSYSTGTYKNESDIDICIIANENTNPYLLMRDITRKIIEVDVRIEPVVFLSEDFHDDQPRGLLREIKEHGIEM